MRPLTLLFTLLLLLTPALSYASGPDEPLELSSWQIEQFDHTSDLLSDITVGLALALPALLVADPDFPADTTAVSYAGALSLSFGTKSLAKALIDAPRPPAYLDQFGPDATDAYDSFPSGHTTMAFTAASFLTTAAILRPDLLQGRVMTVAAGCTSLAAATGYLRYRSGSHHPVDIAAGILLGSLVGSVTAFLLF